MTRTLEDKLGPSATFRNKQENIFFFPLDNFHPP